MSNKSVEAAKALESFGWALVKYAQKVQAGNVGMAHKWWLTAKVRQYVFSKKRREVLYGRNFIKGPVSRIARSKVDVFLDWGKDFRDFNGNPALAPHIGYGYDSDDWIGCDSVKAWRYSV